MGFPGETQQDFNQLYEFIEQAKFDRLGAFKYSKEDGTPAANLTEQIHYKTKTSRYNKIMQLQQKISNNQLQSCINNIYKVLVEGKSYDGKWYLCRSYMDVPDIDGIIYVKNDKQILTGSFIYCKITDVKDYDLIGKIIE